MKFILTIDTEGDNQWDHGRELTVENIKYIPRFQNLCEKYSIRPTYLITSEVCEDSFAQEIFTQYLQSGKAEIGSHLHSWTTPPFQDKDGYRFNDPTHAFATELPDLLLIEKIKVLTDQIENSFGIKPRSFRSGRYGFDVNVAKILCENSYLVDSSVTPYLSWASHKGIPDGKGGPVFLENTPFPYKYDFSNRSLLEIPITILPTMFPLNRSKEAAKYYFSNVDNSLSLRVFRKIFFSNQPLWLRPHPRMSLELLNDLLKESLNIKLPYIVMMFHSSELMPGCSIYRADKDAVDKLYHLIEQFFILLYDTGISSVTLTEASVADKLGLD
jgi:hypothetical protein